MVIPCIAESLGYLPYEHEAVHDAVVRQIVGLRPGSDPRLQIRQSTHDMDRDDFGVLIESTVIWAATELGIVIPDPDKQWHMKPNRGRSAGDRPGKDDAGERPAPASEGAAHAA